VNAAGGTPLVNRVGHAFFKARMHETGAIFGGEVSGHYYFRDFGCIDSGTLPALMMLELLSERGRSLGAMVGEFREKYFITGEINSTVDDQQAVIDEIERRYGDGEISKLDGISVDYPDWHFNVRPSNTEPLLRLNLEAFSQADMETRRDELLALIRS
ncbi:MAG: phosphomannomutase/phosphoglucomutase, partial [Thermoleophilia bacterium]|nr:phosphomannomutase/phosphoglucomutase [Thermoleophilia bacterium]